MDRIKLCPEPMTKEAKPLTTAGRAHIKPKNFVFPKSKGYPIEDPKHARNALSRVSQHGSPAEKATVRAKVHAKFPGIGEKKGEAMDEEAVDKLAAALALGTTLAEQDLLGLRKEAVEIAGRLMGKAAQESGTMDFSGGGPVPGSPVNLPPRAPLSPSLPQPIQEGQQAVDKGVNKTSAEQVPASPVLPTSTGLTPPKPPTPTPPVPAQPGGEPRLASAKFAQVLEATRQRMLNALTKMASPDAR
jgi:hypothetical protein